MSHKIELVYWETETPFDCGTELKYNGKSISTHADDDNIEGSLELLFKEMGLENEFSNFEFEEWDYTCGDGCCYDWGTEITYKGNEVSAYGKMHKDTIKMVFKAIKVAVEVN